MVNYTYFISDCYRTNVILSRKYAKYYMKITKFFQYLQYNFMIREDMSKINEFDKIVRFNKLYFCILSVYN
jgi:hypothetical protein